MVHEEYYANLTYDLTSKGHWGYPLAVNTTMRAEARGALHSFLLRHLSMVLSLSHRSETSALEHNSRSYGHCRIGADILLTLSHYYEDDPFSARIYDLASTYPRPMDAFHQVRRLSLHVDTFLEQEVGAMLAAREGLDVIGKQTWSMLVNAMTGLHEIEVCISTHRGGIVNLNAISFSVRKILRQLASGPKVRRIELLYKVDTPSSWVWASGFTGIPVDTEVETIVVSVLNAAEAPWRQEQPSVFTAKEYHYERLAVFTKVGDQS